MLKMVRLGVRLICPGGDDLSCYIRRHTKNTQTCCHGRVTCLSDSWGDMPRTASLGVKLICPDGVICLQEDKQRTASRGVKLICTDGVICLQEDKQRTVKLGVKSSMSWWGDMPTRRQTKNSQTWSQE
jgi:hypothetical protein